MKDNTTHITLRVQDNRDLSHGNYYVDKKKIDRDDTQMHLNRISEKRRKGQNLLQEGNLQLFRIKNGYVIQACYGYEKKDILGRRIAFMALITGVQNIDEAIDLLEDSSEFINQKCSPDDIKKIKEAGKKQCIDKKRFIVLAILVLIIIAIILCLNNLIKK
ncbi:hypothetical protein EZS27_014929 [termite gut metagenome]|uniref:Uncharacterized protein n=1 Tax=termite gut metagenome TaxID=433724 RepID=A0A5J4RTM3_9ZZZZ